MKDTVPTYFVTGGPCQHLICLTADVEAFRNTYGGDALELVSDGQDSILFLENVTCTDD